MRLWWRLALGALCLALAACSEHSGDSTAIHCFNQGLTFPSYVNNRCPDVTNP